MSLVETVSAVSQPAEQTRLGSRTQAEAACLGMAPALLAPWPRTQPLAVVSYTPTLAHGVKGKAAHFMFSVWIQNDLSRIVQAYPVGMCITLLPLKRAGRGTQIYWQHWLGGCLFVLNITFTNSPPSGL